jgi:hypothetical protein
MSNVVKFRRPDANKPPNKKANSQPSGQNGQKKERKLTWEPWAVIGALAVAYFIYQLVVTGGLPH